MATLIVNSEHELSMLSNIKDIDVILVKNKHDNYIVKGPFRDEFDAAYASNVDVTFFSFLIPRLEAYLAASAKYHDEPELHKEVEQIVEELKLHQDDLDIYENVNVKNTMHHLADIIGRVWI